MKTSYKLLAGLAVGLLMLTATTSALKAQTSPFTITILKPVQEEALTAGSQYTIRWQTQGDTSSLREYVIFFYNGKTKQYEEPIRVSLDQTSYTWTVPSVINDSHYLLIGGAQKTGETTWSQFVKFKIVSPFTITILKPVQEEALTAGSQYTIRWQTQGDTSSLREYVIFFYNGKTKQYETPIIKVPSDQTSYNWTVPSVISDGHYLLIGGVLKTGGTTWSQFVKFKIVSPSTNQSPVIDGISGPTQLQVNEQGTWTIRAHDPENGSLSYSVKWGDESLLGTTSLQPTFVQTTTFTHTYTRVGIYTIEFTVKDNQNQTAKTTTTVNVVSSQTTHKECQNQKCVSVSGSGTDQCQSDNDCAKPAIIINSPADNDQLAVGSSVNICWQVNGNLNLVSKYTVYFWSNIPIEGMKAYDILATINDKNQTCYTWTVPNKISTGQYLLIGATLTDNSKVYSSLKPISIISAATPTVSCSASPNPANVGQTVTWTATASNFSGTPTYTWSGDVTGTGNPKTASYTTTGTKTATVTATYGNQTATSTCSVQVNAVQTQACGDNTSRCVFVTSQIYYPTFGGVEGGDKICNDLAKASGLPGTYKAWLSGFDSTHKLAINVSDRLEHSTLPYKLVTGEIVANNWQELTTKPLLHAININEKGQKVTPRWVWTGSMPNGARTPATLGAVSPDCSNWNARYACCASCGWNDSTNNDPRGFNPVTGENIMPPSWGGEINARLGCDQQYHLYCFQQGSALGSLSTPLSSVQQSITQQLANLYQIVVQLLQQIQALKGQ